MSSGKNSAPPAPNYAPMQAASDYAADKAYAAADQDLAFRKQVYEESQPREQELYNLANRIANQQMGIADVNEQRAGQQWQQHQQTFGPTELSMVADAFGAQYMSPEERAQLNDILTGGGGLGRGDQLSTLQNLQVAAENRAAGDAQARASGQVSRVFGQQSRALGRVGMGDANRTALLAGKLGQQQALAQVGASNAAREGVRNQGVGLRAGAASFGRNMPNTAGQAYGLATGAGSSAMANANQGFMAGLPYAQFAAGGYGTQLGAAGLGQQGALGMGGLQNQGYGIQMQGFNAQQQSAGAGLAGLGQLGGMALAAGTGQPWWLAAGAR